MRLVGEEARFYEHAVGSEWASRSDVKDLLNSNTWWRSTSSHRRDAVLWLAAGELLVELGRRYLTEGLRKGVDWRRLSGFPHSRKNLAIGYVVGVRMAEWGSTLGSAELSTFRDTVVDVLNLQEEFAMREKS
jgi:hypothetical protein